MNDSQQKKMQLVEKYAKFAWPIHRVFVKKYLSPRCKTCLVTEKYSPFEQGICKKCIDYKMQKEKPESAKDCQSLAKELNETLKNVNNTGSEYDALLLLSGGKDSAYLLHKLKTDHPHLRILCFTVDNGFFSTAAQQNINQILKKINVDHIVIKPKISLYQNVFQYALNNIGKNGCSEVVDRMDGDLLHDLARHYAAKMKIPFIISGVSWAQVEQIFEVHHFEMPRNLELTKREYSGKVKIADALPKEDLAYWWDPTSYEQNDVARFIFPFYAWRLSEEEIKEKVLDLGLIDKNKISPLVTNNATIPVMGIADINKIGYSSFEPEFAQMIREGKADRKLWLNIFEMNEFVGKTGWLLGKDVRETLSILKINPSQIGLPV